MHKSKDKYLETECELFNNSIIKVWQIESRTTKKVSQCIRGYPVHSLLKQVVKERLACHIYCKWNQSLKAGTMKSSCADSHSMVHEQVLRCICLPEPWAVVWRIEVEYAHSTRQLKYSTNRLIASYPAHSKVLLWCLQLSEVWMTKIQVTKELISCSSGENT